MTAVVLFPIVGWWRIFLKSSNQVDPDVKIKI